MPNPFQPKKDSTSQSKNPNLSGLDRRIFLKMLAMCSLTAAGCGNSEDFVFSGSGGANGNGGGSGGPQVNPPGLLTGRVRLEDFGGGPLVLHTAHQQNVPVNPDGTFTIKVTGNPVPQVLFLVGGTPAPNAQVTGGLSNLFSGPLKGVGLYIPGLSEAFEFSLNATAMTLVFLASGILTVDVTEALERSRRIVQLQSFSNFASVLSVFLANESLAEAGNSPTFQAAKQACVDEFFESVLGRLTASEQRLLIPQGLLRVTKDETDPLRHKSSFENFGFRWGTVIRQELDSNGNSTVPPVKPPLFGANVGGATTTFSDTDGLLGGANSLGWGNIWLKQALDAGTGVDGFTPHPQSTRVRYWIHGPGHGDDLPPLPEDIDEKDFGHLGGGLTLFTYMILPIFDAFSGGMAGLGFQKMQAKFGSDPAVLDSLDNLKPFLDGLLSLASFSLAWDQLVANLKTESPANIHAAMIEAGVAFTSGLVGVLQSSVALLIEEALAASAAAVGTASFEGLIATVVGLEIIAATLALIASVFAVGGLAFGLINFSRAVQDYLRLPALVQFTHVLRVVPYDLVVYPAPQNPGGSFAVTVHLNNKAEAIVHEFDSQTGGDTVIWQPLLGGVLDPDRETIGLPYNSTQEHGFLNDNGYLAYEVLLVPGGYTTVIRRGPTAEFVLLDDARVKDNEHFPRPQALNSENLMAGIRIGSGGFTFGQFFLYDLSPGGALTIVDLATKLSIPGAVVSYLDMNDLGQVVGVVSNEFQEFQGLFVYLPDGTARIIVSPEQTNAGFKPTINNQGQILTQDADGLPRLIDLEGSLIRTLILPGGYTFAGDIMRGALNDLDQVVFMASTQPSEGVELDRIILWDSDGSSQDLTDSVPTYLDEGVARTRFIARQINDNGVIVGRYLADVTGADFRIFTTALLVPRPL